MDAKGYLRERLAPLPDGYTWRVEVTGLTYKYLSLTAVAPPNRSYQPRQSFEISGEIVGGRDMRRLVRRSRSLARQVNRKAHTRDLVGLYTISEKEPDK